MYKFLVLLAFIFLADVAFAADEPLSCEEIRRRFYQVSSRTEDIKMAWEKCKEQKTLLNKKKTPQEETPFYSSEEFGIRHSDR